MKKCGIDDVFILNNEVVMRPKDKTLNKQLIDHIDMLYKMIEKMNVKISVENKAIKSSIAKIGKRVDKVEKED